MSKNNKETDSQETNKNSQETNKNNQEELNQFITPRSRYHGEFTPQNLAFNANLQEFAQRVSLICGLETGGKVSSAEAYDDIRKLWKELKASKKNLIKKKKND
ncbi:MAG: hypothetical protein AAFN12_06855 [Cyanobacteria bacterium J06560_2]